jgi:hypothetical protein
MSLAPLPAVDGGTILKWTLVTNGKTEREADKLVHRVDWMLGAAVVFIGVVLIVMKIWMIGLMVLATGVFVLGITARADSFRQP